MVAAARALALRSRPSPLRPNRSRSLFPDTAFDTAHEMRHARARHGRTRRLRQPKAIRSRRPPRRTRPQGVPAPSLAEAKDIAEEGFIYGLPLVMNYAVMHEFAVDRNSGQFKAPFNEINNDAPRRHPGGHGRHHAEQRHALLDSSGWICAPSRW